MKARIKKTGEIVDVYHETQHGTPKMIYKESVLVNSRMWTEDELELIQEQTEDEHWQNIRERAAIAVMQGIISTLSTSDEIPDEAPNEIAEFAVACADSLIEQLKKKK